MGGDDSVWVSDDSLRYIVCLRTRLGIGTIDLLLKKAPPSTADSLPR